MDRGSKTRKLVLRKQENRFDRVLAVLVFALTIFGLLMVADASSVRAELIFGDKLFFARQQAIAAGIGLAGFIVASFIPLVFWRKVAVPFFLVTLVLLVLVLIPGIGVQALGARRWINISGFTFQPGEIVKLSLILYLARLFDQRSTVNLLPFFFATAVVAGLVVAEPDLGTATILVASAFSVFFMSGAPIELFLILLPVIGVIGAFLVWVSPYRRERLLNFLGSIVDPLQSSYHTSQVLLALAGGGLLGVGLGQSRSKYLFLPEAANDSIFAVIAEELGFVGIVALLGVFVLLISRIFRISLNCSNVFAKLVAGGIATWIGIQTFINVAAMTATLPITGIPLPFISYGGTSLVVVLLSCGIVLRISREKASLVVK